MSRFQQVLIGLVVAVLFSGWAWLYVYALKHDKPGIPVRIVGDCK
jgi:hypothetical protein